MAIEVLHPEPEFVDERGAITRIVDTDDYPLRAVLLITAKKGSIRGNHWHKKDAHYVHCVSGQFRYSEKNMTKRNSMLQSVVLKPGDVVLSAPGMAHSMEFLEDTVFMAYTTERRAQDLYEADTTRVKIV